MAPSTAESIGDLLLPICASQHFFIRHDTAMSASFRSTIKAVAGTEHRIPEVSSAADG